MQEFVGYFHENNLLAFGIGTSIKNKADLISRISDLPFFVGQNFFVTAAKSSEQAKQDAMNAKFRNRSPLEMFDLQSKAQILQDLVKFSCIKTEHD